jgi:hypothetical protein
MRWALIVGAFTLLLGLLLASASARLRRTFSKEHFREVYDGFVGLVPSEVTPKTEASPRAFASSDGLRLVVTDSVTDSTRELHVSIGHGHRTTAPVGQHFAFFLLMILNQNKLSLTPFTKPSGIHHLAFRTVAPVLVLRDFDEAYAQYSTSFRPIPFRREP